jgi:NAD(P)-dependent dehydrogenase (short-subunit alcohol dehydrogenase family)
MSDEGNAHRQAVLVIGGYGNFGQRICRALAREPGIEVIVAGRDSARAQTLAASLGGAARGVRGLSLDLSSATLAAQIASLQAAVVIHTAGPFQQQAYGVARATAQAGAHYIDLADGRRFVCDFAKAVGPAFEAAGRTAITGASSVPGLSSSVVDHLTAGWQRIDSIDTCIAPAQTAPRGVATLEGVLSYCGQALQVWDQGRWQARRGWAQPERVVFQRLKPRLGALCDVPDLELFVSHYRVTERVMFRAAVEVSLAQRVFAGLAALGAAGVVSQPARLASWINRAGDLLNPLGSALGGMVVRVAGLDAQGHAARRAWHIAADHDHGPEIPCMAAVLLTRRLLAGQQLPAGAMPCLGLLPLQAFAPEFKRWGMVSDVVDETRQPEPHT